MTIDEAIKALKNLEIYQSAWYYTDSANATHLGIEALKRIVASRAIYEKTNPQLLPGETEEVRK